MSSTKKRWEVLAVGGVNVDYVLQVPRLPGRDEKVSALFKGRFPGGPAANFACAASRLGLSVASVVTVGLDQEGELVAEDFTRFGVDTSLISHLENYRTPFTMIMIDESGERAIVVPDHQEQYPLDQLYQALPDARSVYMMPVMFSEFIKVANKAREHGLDVMVDIEANHKLTDAQFDQVMQSVTIASFNHGGFRHFTKLDPTIEDARKLLSDTLHTVIISLGSGGSLAVTHDQEAQCPAFLIPVVDTTGAGDAFNAGFLTGTFMGMSLFERLKFANGVAAIKIQSLGTRGHLPERKEVQNWIIQQENKAK